MFQAQQKTLIYAAEHWKSISAKATRKTPSWIQQVNDTIWEKIKKYAGKGTVKVGTQIGNFGKLIKNPNIKWISSREHALNKVIKRGITESQIKSWIKNGKVIQQDDDTFMYVLRKMELQFLIKMESYKQHTVKTKKGWRKKEMFGLQKNKGYKEISKEFMNALDSYFKDRLDCFVVSNQMDTPHTEFRIEFVMYKFLNVILDYDRGLISCGIPCGDSLVMLENSQEWYDKLDMGKFLKELEFQLELRIPDKFLKHYGWK